MQFALPGTLCLLGFFAMNSHAADQVTWRPVTDAILRIDDRAPKQWGLFRTGKKYDPLLLQLGNRALVIYVREQAVYELAAGHLKRKNQDLLWRESDRPSQPVPTSEWSTRDIGSAWRVRVTLSDEGRAIDIQIPQTPDLRGLY